MLKSLGADISSPLSSQEPVVLEFVGRNLSVVRSLNSATQVMSRFTSRLGDTHGIKTEVSPAKVLTGLLNLSRQRYINPQSIRDLYGDVAKQNPEVEVLLAQDLLNSVRNLSTDLFDKDDARLRIVQSMEQLIDGLVDAEDAWLENGGN
jgi:type III secretion protein W